MSDNKNDPPLDESKLPESEQYSNDAANTKNSQNPQSIQDLENMEVHHHAHAAHGKKTWKNYFWEFIMLFFAVFCGFLAEYQLEHTIEHDREKQYIAAMIADMEDDSAKINATLAFSVQQLDGFDKILINIYDSPYTDSSLRVLYYTQLKYAHTRNFVAFTKRTITQLINSGGLRLIRNKAALDSITIYNEECELAEAQADYFERVRMGKVFDYSLKLFDNNYILDEKGQVQPSYFSQKSEVKLLDDSEILIREYANSISYARGSLRTYINFLKQIQEKIPSKLKFLKDKYH